MFFASKNQIMPIIADDFTAKKPPLDHRKSDEVSHMPQMALVISVVILQYSGSASLKRESEYNG